MTTTAPTSPCFAIFHGVRHSTRSGYVEMLHEPVQVAWYDNGSVTELAVTLCGRATRWPLRMFSGEWAEIHLEES